MAHELRELQADVRNWKEFALLHSVSPFVPGFEPSRREPSECYCLRFDELRVKLPPTALTRLNSPAKGTRLRLSFCCLRFFNCHGLFRHVFRERTVSLPFFS